MLVKFLKWLTSLLETKPAPMVGTQKTETLPVSETGRTDVFKLSERHIYRYWNGEKEVTADPIELYKDVMSVWPDIDRELTLCTFVGPNGGFNDSFKAHSALLDRIRSVFKIKILHEGGLTNDELVLLVDHFLKYTMEVKKNWRLSPTIPQAILRALSSPSAENPPTTNTSDSGATGNVSPTDVPEKSSTESKSPSETSPPDSLTT